MVARLKSGKPNSAARRGIESDILRNSQHPARSSQRTGAVEVSADHALQLGVSPMTALRATAFRETQGTPQIASEERDNNAIFALDLHLVSKTKVTAS